MIISLIFVGATTCSDVQFSNEGADGSFVLSSSSSEVQSSNVLKVGPFTLSPASFSMQPHDSVYIIGCCIISRCCVACRFLANCS